MLLTIHLQCNTLVNTVLRGNSLTSTLDMRNILFTNLKSLRTPSKHSNRVECLGYVELNIVISLWNTNMGCIWGAIVNSAGERSGFNLSDPFHHTVFVWEDSEFLLQRLWLWYSVTSYPEMTWFTFDEFTYFLTKSILFL